jgi:8-oxo-dGDP phosphatase
LSRLDHSSDQPHRTLTSRELARAGPLALVVDEVELAAGTRFEYRWFKATSAAFIVPILGDLDTILVRQWRYPWRETSWEVPAGTLAEGEDPLEGARRELVEEAGLVAEEWDSLGVMRPSALLDSRQYLFLAREVREVARAPEVYEADMITRRLPLREAVDVALGGGIHHATAASALCRAARHVGLL